LRKTGTNEKKRVGTIKKGYVFLGELWGKGPPPLGPPLVDRATRGGYELGGRETRVKGGSMELIGKIWKIVLFRLKEKEPKKSLNQRGRGK